MKKENQKQNNTFPMRLNKYMSFVGMCSRKEADKLIEGGKVLVNGKVATLGTKIEKKMLLL